MYLGSRYWEFNTEIICKDLNLLFSTELDCYTMYLWSVDTVCIKYVVKNIVKVKKIPKVMKNIKILYYLSEKVSKSKWSMDSDGIKY